MRSAAVGFHCPDCTRAGSKEANAAMRRVIHQQRPYITIALVVAGVAVFLLDQVWRVDVQGLRFNYGNQPVLGWEAALYGPNVYFGDWWRPLTVGFVHANLLHVGFNMFLLYMLGQMLEPALGRARFAALYLLSLLGGSALILVIQPTARTVGASGAVFGLMGAAFVGMRARGVIPFQTAIGPLLVMNIFISFMPGISLWGHFGGLIAGAAAGWLLFELPSRVHNGELVSLLFTLAAVAALYYACLEIPGPDTMPLPSSFDFL
jgi:membrane associated rhomboid family serine protease